MTERTIKLPRLTERERMALIGAADEVLKMAATEYRWSEKDRGALAAALEKLQS